MLPTRWVLPPLWVLPLALLAGCSNSAGKTSLNPIDWWHNLQGGKIAEERPPPPNADQPYPNLATVPARPTPPDKQAMQQLTDSLVGDRVNAQHTAAENPLTDPTLPSASPGLFGVGTLPPPPPRPAPAGQATASLDAASSTGAGSPPPAQTAPAPVAAPSAPPAPAPSGQAAAPPSRAPLRPVESAPLEAPAAPPVATPPAVVANPSPRGTPPPAVPSPSASAPVGNAPVPAAPPVAAAPPAAPPPIAAAPTIPPPIAAVPPQNAAPPAAAPAPASPASPQQTASASLPPLPSEPPPRPGIAGPAPSATPQPQNMPVASGNAARVVFAPGAATLSPEDINLVKSFASKRGSAVIAITGFGDAAGNDITSQTNALGLGLSRAQAVANELTSAGVPQSAIRVGAEAAGRGARLLLLQ